MNKTNLLLFVMLGVTLGCESLPKLSLETSLSKTLIDSYQCHFRGNGDVKECYLQSNGTVFVLYDTEGLGISSIHFKSKTEHREHIKDAINVSKYPCVIIVRWKENFVSESASIDMRNLEVNSKFCKTAE